jgi:hypothetical protein
LILADGAVKHLMNSSRSLTEARTGAAFYHGCVIVGQPVLHHSDVALILVVSAAWAVLYNLQFGTCQSLRCGIRRRVLRCPWLCSS